MYHSVATLLNDGSVWVGGSNPNVDVITEQNNASYPYKTEWRVERFYPSYYDSPRPAPTGLPTSLSYGGDPFTLALPSSSVDGVDLEADVSVMLIRTGFSTQSVHIRLFVPFSAEADLLTRHIPLPSPPRLAHGPRTAPLQTTWHSVMNMGQRALELQHTYSLNSDGSATLHVSQLPPLPGLFAPGPALLFVVVKGVPSNGTTVMVGSGKLGTQPTAALPTLPTSSRSSSRGGSNASSNGSSSGAPSLSISLFGVVLAAVVAMVACM
ncbi:hypothetical protein JCM10213v2_008584 [Rhodosporidiobolus nylandii]